MLPIARDTESSERESVVEVYRARKASHGPSEPPDQDPPYDPPAYERPQKLPNDFLLWKPFESQLRFANAQIVPFVRPVRSPAPFAHPRFWLTPLPGVKSLKFTFLSFNFLLSLFHSEDSGYQTRKLFLVEKKEIHFLLSRNSFHSSKPDAGDAY
jgi:hypothetical protein